jgi:hypothetical protein
MTRERLSTLITAGVMTGALAFLVAKNKGVTLTDLKPAAIAQSLAPKTPSPEDSIYGMLDSAKAGDTNSYLASYTGHMKDALRQSVTEATPSGFEKYLRTSNAAIQGVALTPPEKLSDSQVKVRVEYVYKDRNEVQFVYLMKEGSGWKIYQVDSAERIKTLVPYGSAVTD